MAFGAELRDFVAGFQAGYNMFESKEEREWKREQRQMQRENHEMGKEDRNYRRDQDKKEWDWRQSGREYDQGRDAKSDARQDRLDREAREDKNWTKGRTTTRDAMEDEDRARRSAREERELQIKEREHGVKVRENNRMPDLMERYIDRDKDKRPSNWKRPATTDEQSAIPDPDAVLQPASYSPTDANGFQEVVRAGKGWTEVKLSDGTVVRRKGARNWRNNNPGNIEYGPFAKKLGAIGTDGRFAVFPTYDDGRRAKAELLFNSKGYRNKTLEGAINRYAPPFENNTDAYVNSVARAIGVDPGTPIRALSEEQREVMLDAMQKVEGFKEGREKILGAVSMASGGLVEAIPDEPEDQMYAAEDALMEQWINNPDAEEAEEAAQTAIPDPYAVEEPPADTGGKSYGDMYSAAREAVREGMNKAAEDLGLDVEGGIDDPEMEKAYENYVNGYGAAPDQLMRQVLDSVDPNREYPPAERNMLAMGTVYRFYMDNGQPKEAQEAAKSMVQYYRTISTRFMGLAQAAAEEGELDDAARAAVAAYANIPNGRDLDIKQTEKGFEISVTDTDTGKQIIREVLNPRDFAAMAMQFDASTFEDEIFRAAGEEPEKLTDASLEDIRITSEGTKDLAGEMWADMPPERRVPLTDAASRIATLKENQMGMEEALRFVDPSDTEPFDIRPVKLRPDMVEVTKNGKTVIMTKGHAKALMGVRKSIADETIKKAEEDKQSAAEWQDIYKKGEDAAGALVDRAIEDFNEPSTTEKVVKGVTDTLTSPRTMDDVEAETAIPEQTGPRKTFSQLLVEREELAAAEQTPEVAARLAEVNRILKEMGLNE